MKIHMLFLGTTVRVMDYGASLEEAWGQSGVGRHRQSCLWPQAHDSGSPVPLWPITHPGCPFPPQPGLRMVKRTPKIHVHLLNPWWSNVLLTMSFLVFTVSHIPDSSPNSMSFHQFSKILIPGKKTERGRAESIHPTPHCRYPKGPQGQPLSPHLPGAPPKLPNLRLREAELLRVRSPNGAFICSTENWKGRQSKHFSAQK